MKTVIALGNLVINKFFAIVILAALLYAYHAIPPVSFDVETGVKSGGMPFAELLFAAILIFSTVVVTPLVRLLFFPESAYYAECGGLDDDLRVGIRTLDYAHYRLATIVSFAVTLATLATLAH